MVKPLNDADYNLLEDHSTTNLDCKSNSCAVPGSFRLDNAVQQTS